MECGCFVAAFHVPGFRSSHHESSSDRFPGTMVEKLDLPIALKGQPLSGFTMFDFPIQSTPKKTKRGRQFGSRFFGRAHDFPAYPRLFTIHSPRHSPFQLKTSWEVNECYFKTSAISSVLTSFRHWLNIFQAFVKRRSKVQVLSAAFSLRRQKTGKSEKSGFPVVVCGEAEVKSGRVV